MTRAATISVSPHAGLEDANEKTLRQFAIAAILSLAAHALVLALFVAPNYEVARLAGGGASFGLSGGGLGEGSDTAPESEAEAMEDADSDPSEALDQTLESEAQAAVPSESASAVGQSAPDAVSPATEASTAQRQAPAATPPPSASQKSPASAQKSSAQKPKADPVAASRRSTGSTGSATPTGAQGNNTGAASEAKAANAAPSGGKSNSGTGTGSGSAKTGEGNSATSNYTGIVTAHIRRNRRSNVAGAGSVILKLGIASNGRIDIVDIYRSSGSTRFDRQAMRMARMAAPYPKPPAGQGPVLVRIKGS